MLLINFWCGIKFVLTAYYRQAESLLIAARTSARYFCVLLISRPLLLLYFAFGFSIAAYADCYEHTTTQLSMNQCAAQQWVQAEQAVDELIRQMTSNATQQDKILLIDAFQTYKHYVQKQCSFNVRDTKGGSIHSMVLFNCKTELLHEYMRHLTEQMQCVEGDVSCSSMQ